MVEFIFMLRWKDKDGFERTKAFETWRDRDQFRALVELCDWRGLSNCTVWESTKDMTVIEDKEAIFGQETL